MKDCNRALRLQIMEGSRSHGRMNSVIRLPNEEYDCLLPPSSSSSSSSSLHPQISMASCHASQDLPLSWSQLLLGESYTDEEKYGLATTLDRRKMDNCWEQQMVNPARFALTGIQQEFYGKVLPASFSSTLSKNMFEFSNKNNMYIQLANSSSECNSIRTGIAPKKARFQGSFSTQSTFKVRKEKIGDRITALHQLVSPFGKTDTASVLLEVSGYIRFLQSQIEALSLPYLSSAPGNMKHPQTGRNNNEGEKKDLKSRGLCLVPVSFILQV
ncbi:transcription factor bHLH68-like isoform X1 [Zingiber officinale]|uniref:transcription factor bHLH68-like isoform X1 n=1 Tax=Zingiber officinale TaxID=94328 RepID=UPI001C4B0DB6|nr:transcription factor bHLH68-like isoform X1 [Zingiber officinale]XP_042416728.1 transcription factor bHLH68-like isoform X1 [Zingiber officinale]